jgi:hypothetical protein
LPRERSRLARNAHHPKKSDDAQSDPVLIEKPASRASYEIISGQD